MNASLSHSPFARNPASMAAPILAKLSISSPEAVFGWSDRTSAEWCIARDRGNLVAAEKNFAAACRDLGNANRSKTMRRIRKATAMRNLNSRRARLRQARAALTASLAALPAGLAS